MICQCRPIAGMYNNHIRKFGHRAPWICRGAWNTPCSHVRDVGGLGYAVQAFGGSLSAVSSVCAAVLS